MIHECNRRQINPGYFASFGFSHDEVRIHKIHPRFGSIELTGIQIRSAFGPSRLPIPGSSTGPSINLDYLIKINYRK